MVEVSGYRAESKGVFPIFTPGDVTSLDELEDDEIHGGIWNASRFAAVRGHG